MGESAQRIRLRRALNVRSGVCSGWVETDAYRIDILTQVCGHKSTRGLPLSDCSQTTLRGCLTQATGPMVDHDAKDSEAAPTSPGSSVLTDQATDRRVKDTWPYRTLSFR